MIISNLGVNEFQRIFYLGRKKLEFTVLESLISPLSLANSLSVKRKMCF